MRIIKVLFFLSMAFTLGFALLLISFEKELVRTSGYGTVALQFAFTPENAARMIGGWSGVQKKQAVNALLTDFGFLSAGYGLLLLTAGVLLSSRRISIIGISAAVLDLTENLLHLTMIRFSCFGLAPPASIASMLKFALILTAVVLILFAVIGNSRKKRGESHGG